MTGNRRDSHLIPDGSIARSGDPGANKFSVSRRTALMIRPPSATPLPAKSG